MWFPEPTIPVAAGQQRVLPVLVMTLAFSRYLSATMIPSRQAVDILSGMWQLIGEIGRVTTTLVRDREAAISGSGRVSAPAAAFAGTLASKIVLTPPRDPEFKGMVERNNRFLETSFLPGRRFASPTDFNEQLHEWLQRANARSVRAVQGRPRDLLETDYLAMLPLPSVTPSTGLSNRIRLSRDYYVRRDTIDYSADPRVIGKFVDVTVSPTEVTVWCQVPGARCQVPGARCQVPGARCQIVAHHQSSWAKNAVITDPQHQALATSMRHALANKPNNGPPARVNTPTGTQSP